jgi:23S rRNA (pseudouridine1915-N3)-methyltransferase
VRLSILSIGRLKAGPEQELCARYLDRLAKAGPAVGLEWASSVDLPESRAGSAAERKRDEARRLLAALPERATLIVLDERGRQLSTADLSGWIASRRDDGTRDLAVMIGGPDGLDDEVRTRADLALAFGRLTWPHQMVRVMLAEQLYRVATVLSGHPYHRE